jgi:hypothetical protein
VVAAQEGYLEIFPLHPIPPHNAYLDGDRKPEPVVTLENAIHRCDGLLIASPAIRLISPMDKEKIGHPNAKRLLRLEMS